MQKTLKFLFVLLVLELVGCLDRGATQSCPESVEVHEIQPLLGCGGGMVDVLIVIDNSDDMAPFEDIISTGLVSFINGLINPAPSWEPSFYNIRIAVITSDMGLQWGGNPFDPNADEWFSDNVPEQCEGPLGDNGHFITDYDDARILNFIDGQIACEMDGNHCPDGWQCGNMNTNTGVGVCIGAAPVNCFQGPSDYGTSFISMENGLWYEEELAYAAACLANVQKDGCDFAQSWTAAVAALSDEIQNTQFLREDSHTVVLFISNDDDHSIASSDLFAVSQMQDAETLHLGAGAHPQYLYSAADIREALLEAKRMTSGGAFHDLDRVYVASIVGVPPGETCEGAGSGLASCLDDIKMSLRPVEVLLSDGSGVEMKYDYACTVTDENGQVIAGGRPGRRHVELAREFGALGRIFSICNRDWSTFAEEMVSLLSSAALNYCFPYTPLKWDEHTQTAACEMALDFSGEVCPEGEEWVREEQIGDGLTPVVRCTVAPIPRPFDCKETTLKEWEQINETQFGWYYCENTGENFNGSCNDEEDNDLDGMTDCEQSECDSCPNCAADGVGDPIQCPSLCKYNVVVTDSALRLAAGALRMSLRCPNQSTADSANCSSEE